VINEFYSLHSSTSWFVCAVHGGLPMQCSTGQHDSLLCGRLNLVKPAGELQCFIMQCGVWGFLASKLTACMSTACMPSIVKMAYMSDPICLMRHLHECNHASYFPARIAAMVSQVLLACQQDHVITTQEMCNMPIFIHHEQVNFARAAY